MPQQRKHASLGTPLDILFPFFTRRYKNAPCCIPQQRMHAPLLTALDIGEAYPRGTRVYGAYTPLRCIPGATKTKPQKYTNVGRGRTAAAASFR